MKTTAAVLVETGKPLELAELSIPALQPGQVLVEIAYSGVCHTQILEWRGYRGDDPHLPHCLGHEASGTVIDVGAEVTRCRAGDRVVLSWIKGSGANVPGTVYDWNGRKVNAGGVTTFSQHAVVSENRVTVLADSEGDADLKSTALLGCAVATGVGAVMNTAGVRTSQSVAVYGVGGIGLCSVMAAAVSGASPIIAVDVNQGRLSLAQELGATHSIDAKMANPLDSIEQIASGGVDVAIEASGRPVAMQQALVCVRPRGGTAVIIGNAWHGERLELDPGQLNQGKRLLGTWGGDSQPDRDFPRYLKLIREGRFNLFPLMTDTYELIDINNALEDLEAGRVVRPLIAMDND